VRHLVGDNMHRAIM